MTWEDIAADKNRRIDASIPNEWRIDVTKYQEDSVMHVPAASGILSPQELEITNSSAVDLASRLASGQLKSVEVTLAFCKRAALAHQLLNCCLEFFPEQALAQAKELDAYYEKYKKPIGPLHGLPISLKDQFRIKGLETSMGYVGWIGKYATEDSILVTMLRKAGAVFYVKTSVPQSLMMCETINNIIGRTVNPWNRNLSCGGSSGGEGAMVGFRGALIGVGTDIGGSIRIPSAFNFLYGIKPSHGRMPYATAATSLEGQETVHSVCGPIAHSIEGLQSLLVTWGIVVDHMTLCGIDLKLFITSVLQQEPWRYDSKVIPLPWRHEEEGVIQFKISSGELTLGFFNCDGVVLPHPPILRGVDMVVSTLRENGHTLVPWKPYKHDFAVDLIYSIYVSDSGKDIRSALALSGEPTLPLIANLVSPLLPRVDMNELWDLQLKKWNYQIEYLEQWRLRESEIGKEIDAFIMPVSPAAAVRHNQSKYYGYSSVINLLDWTSVVVPVTFADKAVDKRKDHQPLNKIDSVVQAECKLAWIGNVSDRDATHYRDATHRAQPEHQVHKSQCSGT